MSDINGYNSVADPTLLTPHSSLLTYTTSIKGEIIMITNIAIDGPAGAGKSTIAKTASKELGFIYVDTGALYRTVGLNALRLGKDTKSADEVVPTLEGLNVSLRFVDGEQRVFLGEEDVSTAIRQNEVSMAASNVSAIPKVREFLFDLQRDIAKKNNCIMDGRDIGTVVLPDAQIKIYLTASAEARADRRFKELTEKGQQVEYDVILKEIKERDYQDMNREIAPLKQADDAVLVDTTELTLPQSIEYMLKVIKERL